MSLNVEVMSRETIRPSSPTPENKSTFKLSLLDQIGSKNYLPIILFYSPTTSIDEQQNRSSLLKQSLSQTLTHMYTLAGRYKDIYSIECKDQGVEYVESRVADAMSTVLNHPKIKQLSQLLPLDTEKEFSPDDVLLSVQVNHFECGGTAVGVCINHVIADLCAASTFLKTWSDIARGEKIEDSFVIDCTTLFPPRDVHGLGNLDLWKPRERRGNRFVFNKSNIAALREKVVAADGGGATPSRMVAVSAFIWAAIIATDAGKNWSMSVSMNLRNRMDHPENLQHSLGNIVHTRLARADAKTDYAALVKVVSSTIQVVTPEDMKKMYAYDEGFANYKKSVETASKYVDKLEWFSTSSWCRFPLYEVDFGWGKPVWVGTTGRPVDLGIFIDTSDGMGIEAWVYLPVEVMNEIEQNDDFLACVSVVQSL